MLPTQKLHSVAIDLEPAHYLRAWRPEAGVLFLPVLSEARVGDESVVRIGIASQTIRATVFGRISMVRRLGRPSLPPGVELAIDPVSLPAARFLALAAQGEKVSFRERAPRYVVSRRLRTLRGGIEREADTLNVSDGGCALAWSGALPAVGEVLSLKLGPTFLGPRARAAVCWTNAGPPWPASLGLRVIAEGRAARAWRALVSEAASSGAQAA